MGSVTGRMPNPDEKATFGGGEHMMENTHFIKVNLPDSEENYRTGNGEGMWVIVDDDTYEKHEADYEGRFFHGKLANNSVYYPGLTSGATVPFEMRGKHRPVVRFQWLDENYGPCVW